MNDAQAYPLAWPPGRTRTDPQRRKRAAFHGTGTRAASYGGGTTTFRREKSVEESTNALLHELGLLTGAGKAVISTNLPLRRDGLPKSDHAPIDPGVAVYFRYQGQDTAFACDRWDRVADNIYAIAKTIEAIRGIARWGSSEMVRAAFTGFRRLPPPVRPWRLVFGFSADETPMLEEVDRRHREATAKHHPDRGGLDTIMAEINAARDQARSELSG